MKTYQISLRYETYAHFEIEADSLEDAEAQAWASIDADCGESTRYGEWSTDNIEEVTA
jgi:hypothetical protein